MRKAYAVKFHNVIALYSIRSSKEAAIKAFMPMMENNRTWSEWVARGASVITIEIKEVNK